MDNVKNERCSNLELLRIVSMIGVIILHYGSYGQGLYYAEGNFINFQVLTFLYSTARCSVDVFVLISGYFLCRTNKRSKLKILEFFVQVILFNAIFYIASVALNVNSFSVKEFLLFCVPNNYFVIFYSVLYLISPYLNIIIENTNKEQLKKLVILLFIIFSVWNCLVDLSATMLGIEWKGLSTVTIKGAYGGFSIVNFVLMYFIAAYLRVTDLKVSNKKLLLVIMGLVTILFGWASLEYQMNWDSVSGNYDNPIVILLAISIFLLFSNMSFSNKYINKLAKAAFTCFLFHQPLMSYIGVQGAVQKNVFFMIAHILGTSIALYLMSYIVFVVYNYVMKITLRKWIKQ